jgi:hypothetical protein
MADRPLIAWFVLQNRRSRAGRNHREYGLPETYVPCADPLLSQEFQRLQTSYNLLSYSPFTGVSAGTVSREHKREMSNLFSCV